MSYDLENLRIEVGDGFYLSELAVSDDSALVRYLNDIDVGRNTLRIPYPYSEEDAAQFITIVANSTAQLGYPVQLAIRDDRGQLIGGCGFDGLRPEHRAEIGYWLAKPFWGRGIMTAVVRSACDFALVEWKLVRITAYVFDFNPASARVLEKNGFSYEGLLRKHIRKNGVYLNSKLYALVT